MRDVGPVERSDVCQVMIRIENVIIWYYLSKFP
jgi:hypothetical protein